MRAATITTLVVASALALSACGFGEEGIAVSEDSPDHPGAVLFAQNCSGCHTLTAAGTQGTGNRGTRTQGPNLDQRPETYESALFAIQNGGYSGAIMPQNIVVGMEAEQVARFVADYAGSDAEDTSAAEEETGLGNESEEGSGEANQPGGDTGESGPVPTGGGTTTGPTGSDTAGGSSGGQGP